MRRHIYAMPAPKLNNPRDVYVGIGCAILLVGMLVSQLFTFEKAVPLLADLGIASQATSQVIMSSIVIAELLALPFLLRMQLSPLMRMMSMVAGWLVAALWLYIAIVSAGTSGHSAVGFFGTIIPLGTGPVAVVIAVILAALLLWATAVLWPSAQTVRMRRK